MCGAPPAPVVFLPEAVQCIVRAKAIADPPSSSLAKANYAANAKFVDHRFVNRPAGIEQFLLLGFQLFLRSASYEDNIARWGKSQVSIEMSCKMLDTRLHTVRPGL